MAFCGAEERGGALEKDEVGLFPAFKVPRPTEPLWHIGSPRPWMFVGSKGIPVSCFSWDIPKPRATIVLVHGYGSHSMFEWLESRPSLDRVCSDFTCNIDLSWDATLKDSGFLCCSSAPGGEAPEKLLSGLQAFKVEEIPEGSQSTSKGWQHEKCQDTTTEEREYGDALNSGRTSGCNPPSHMSYEGSWVQRFVESHCRVVAIDLQSHGSSHGWDHKTCQVEAFDEFALDVKTLLQSLANENSLPLFLCGTSMGGCVCIRAAEMLCQSGLLGRPSFSSAKEDAKSSEVKEQTMRCESVTESDVQVVAEAIGAEHRVTRQKPVPLTGLILLAPMLDSSPAVDDESKASKLQFSLLSFLRNIAPHCGTYSRVENASFPQVEDSWKEDSGCFKGRTRVNLLVEMQAGIDAAQENAHWLRRRIMRDASVPFSIKDWTLLHQRMQQELREGDEDSCEKTDSALEAVSALQVKSQNAEETESRLAVLVVHSLNDTLVPPIGSMRFFEKLGGTVVAPEPWASQLRKQLKEPSPDNQEDLLKKQQQTTTQTKTNVAAEQTHQKDAQQTHSPGIPSDEESHGKQTSASEDKRVSSEGVNAANESEGSSLKEATLSEDALEKVKEEELNTSKEEKQKVAEEKETCKQRSHQQTANWLCCGVTGRGEVLEKKELLYLKRRKWKKVAGVVVDDQGRPVDVEEVAAMMKLVQESGIEPLPDEDTPEMCLLQGKEIELHDDPPRSDLKANAEYASVCREGNLQLWLLTSQWHMLTKEPGNQQLQKNIIDRFLTPTLERLHSKGTHKESETL